MSDSEQRITIIWPSRKGTGRKKNPTRDKEREDKKVATLVQGVIHALTTYDGLKRIQDLANALLQEENNLSPADKTKLTNICKTVDIGITSNDSAIQEFMCSTELEVEKYGIGVTEYNMMKKAIKSGDLSELSKSIHCNADMIRMQTFINSCKEQLPGDVSSSDIASPLGQLPAVHNKASTLVSGVLFTIIIDDGLKLIKELTDSPLQEVDISSTCKRKLMDICYLADITIESNEIAGKRFMRVAEYIKAGAYCISKNEHSHMKRAIKFGETNDLVRSFEANHVTEEILEMQTFINTCREEVPGWRNSSDAVSPADELPTTPKETCQKSDVLDLAPYLELVPPSTSQHYTPLEAVKIITSNSDGRFRTILDLSKDKNNQHPIKQTSPNLIIQIMMEKEYVPLKKMAILKLLREFEVKNELKSESWPEPKSRKRKWL